MSPSFSNLEKILQIKMLAHHNYLAVSELAQTVVDAGAIAHLAHISLNPDAKLKRQVFSALSQISKHSVELAEMVVEAEIFPNILTCLKGIWINSIVPNINCFVRKSCL